MPQRLSGLDAAFLYLETPTNHMHVGAVIVLDPATAPRGRLTRDDFTDFVRQRLHLAPPFRRRLAWVPFNLDHPVWFEDPDFDLDFHVHRVAVPSPGGMREVAELAGEIMGRPIDRGRPLWEVWLVEGLEQDRVALITKTHHAAVDGVSGVELAAAILQLSPDQEPPPPEGQWQPEPEPSDVRLLAGAGLRSLATPVALLRTGRKVAGGALRAALRAVAGASGSRTGGGGERAEPPPAPFAAPMTILNGSVGPHRRIALAELSLTTVKDIKNSLGGTVNDVLLAAIAGALRGYLEGRGESLDEPLVAMVPISVRSEEESGQMGNRVSAMLVELPVDEPDPERRLARVAGGTAGAKEQHGAMGANTIQQFAELAPGAVFSLAARLYSRTRAADRHRPIWNVVVSNVPGPRIPLYCAGARLEAMYPLGPIHEMCGLNITLFSYEDDIFVGLNADRELVGDVEVVAEALRDAVEELAKVAAEQPRTAQ